MLKLIHTVCTLYSQNETVAERTAAVYIVAVDLISKLRIKHDPIYLFVDWFSKYIRVCVRVSKCAYWKIFNNWFGDQCTLYVAHFVENVFLRVNMAMNFFVFPFYFLEKTFPSSMAKKLSENSVRNSIRHGHISFR